MARDIRFEIEYVLSLTVGCLGLLSIKGISSYLDERIGYLFIVFVSTHLLILNSYYIFKNISDIKIRSIDKLVSISQYSFYSVSFCFAYFFSNILVTTFYKKYPVCSEDFSLNLPIIAQKACNGVNFYNHSTLSAKIFILYGFPVLGVLILMMPLLAVVPSLRFFDDVEVVVSPKNLEVTSCFEDTIDISLTFINNDKKDRDFTTVIEVPDDIILRCEGEDFPDEFKRKIHLSEERPADKFSFDLKYTGSTRRQGEIPIEIRHRFSSKTQLVKAQFQP